MIAIDQKMFEEEVNLLLSRISPINASNSRRHDVSHFIREILTRYFQDILVVECGSSCLKSYLPESDLDLILFASSPCDRREQMLFLRGIFNALCEEISQKDEGLSKYYDMTIRNVELVNARTKVTHCVVNNITVDITVNQIGALSTLTFLEEVDRFIGYDHLYKKSLLLIKDWCVHESTKYCGVSILGAKVSMFSTYALSVLVLHLFNRFTLNLTHPFSVLRSFLFTYMAFPWDTHVLTLEGPVKIPEGNRTYRVNDNKKEFNLSTFPNRFETIVDKFNIKSSSPGKTSDDGSINTFLEGFRIKPCNIVDPLDPMNNLGISVSKYNLSLVEKACLGGFHHLESILMSSHVNASQNTLTPIYANVQPRITANTFSCSIEGVNQTHVLGYEQKHYRGSVNTMLQPVSASDMGYVGTLTPGTPAFVASTVTAPVQIAPALTLAEDFEESGDNNEGKNTHSNTVITDQTTSGEQNGADQSVPEDNTTNDAVESGYLDNVYGQKDENMSVGSTSVSSYNSNKRQEHSTKGSSVLPPGYVNDPPLTHQQTIQDSIKLQSNASHYSGHSQETSLSFLAHFFPVSKSIYSLQDFGNGLIESHFRSDMMDHPLQQQTHKQSSNGSVGSSSYRRNSGTTGTGSRHEKESFLHPRTSENPTRESGNGYHRQPIGSESPCSSVCSSSTTGSSRSVEHQIFTPLPMSRYEQPPSNTPASVYPEDPLSLLATPSLLVTSTGDCKGQGGMEGEEGDPLLGNLPAMYKVMKLLTKKWSKARSNSSSSTVAKLRNSANMSGFGNGEGKYSPLSDRSNNSLSPIERKQTSPIITLREKIDFPSLDGVDNKIQGKTILEVVEDLQGGVGQMERTSLSPEEVEVGLEEGSEKVFDEVVKSEKRGKGKKNELKKVEGTQLLSSTPQEVIRKGRKSSVKKDIIIENKRNLIPEYNNNEVKNITLEIQEENVNKVFKTSTGFSTFGITLIISKSWTKMKKNLLNFNRKIFGKKRIKGTLFLVYSIGSILLCVIIAILIKNYSENLSAKRNNDICNTSECLLKNSGGISNGKKSNIENNFWDLGQLWNKQKPWFASAISDSKSHSPTKRIQKDEKEEYFDFDEIKTKRKNDFINPSMQRYENDYDIESSIPVATHWVILGDSISFGDFSGYRNKIVREEALSEKDQNKVFYQWSKDGINLTGVNNIQFPYFTIKKSLFEDAGHYRCIKITSTDPPQVVAETIIQISQIPQVRNKPSYQVVKRGTNFFLKLDIIGVPPPSFQWFKNGYMVPEQTGQALVLDDIDFSHSGTYSCEVFNIAGGFVWLEATVEVIN